MERHPGLRFVFLEAGGGWAPYWIERLDHQVSRFGGYAPEMKLLPSEYFARQCWISFEVDEHTAAAARAGCRHRPHRVGHRLPAPRLHLPGHGEGAARRHRRLARIRPRTDPRAERDRPVPVANLLRSQHPIASGGSAPLLGCASPLGGSGGCIGWVHDRGLDVGARRPPRAAGARGSCSDSSAGVTFGLAAAGVAGARRTEDALPRALAASPRLDAAVLPNDPEFDAEKRAAGRRAPRGRGAPTRSSCRSSSTSRRRTGVEGQLVPTTARSAARDAASHPDRRPVPQPERGWRS